MKKSLKAWGTAQLFSFATFQMKELMILLKQRVNYNLCNLFIWYSSLLENFEKAKMQGYEPSPLARLMKEGSKNLRALNKSELIEDIIFTM